MHTNTTPILIRTPFGLDSNKTQLFSLQNLLLGKTLITTPLYWPGYRWIRQTKLKAFFCFQFSLLSKAIKIH